MTDTAPLERMGDLPLQLDRTAGWAALRAAGVTAAVGFALLGRDPALRDRLRTDEAAIPAFIEEMFRSETPVLLAISSLLLQLGWPAT